MTLKLTPLNHIHRALGAKMVDFGGWDMPVQYSGIIAEHTAVRTRAGLFDVSHMGQCEVAGEQALEAMQFLMANNMDIPNNKAVYTAMCNQKGGIVDDLIIYRMSQWRYYIILNASNAEKDVAWIKEHATEFEVKVTDLSGFTAQLALQGPESEKILQQLTELELSKIKTFWVAEGKVGGIPAIIGRTGYTGEDGFEIYVDAERAEELWKSIMEKGKQSGLLPIGLGARDSLRLESGLMLYGNELDEETSPLEAAIAWTVDMGKDFLGKGALAANPPGRKMVGFELLERSVARHGDLVVSASGERIGIVTSGIFSPTLKKPLGLLMLDSPAHMNISNPGIRIRDRIIPCRFVSHRFYKKPV